jgi:membrane protein YdbS with pleckstrin-like domain
LTWLAGLASAGMYLSIMLAILDIGPHVMGGERVTRAEWLHIAAPLVAVIGVLMAFIAYGFAAQKYWSRHLVIAMFVLIVVYASILGALNLIHHAIMWRAIINGTLFGGASVWYFYSKPNVAAYFRELKDR